MTTIDTDVDYIGATRAASIPRNAREVLASAINHYGDGGHPVVSADSIEYVALDYALNCLFRAGHNLNEHGTALAARASAILIGTDMGVCARCGENFDGVIEIAEVGTRGAVPAHTINLIVHATCIVPDDTIA